MIPSWVGERLLGEGFVGGGVEQRAASAGSAIVNLIIQESCGALLTASGRSLSEVFTAVTVPDSGANSSDTAFTDSMVPNAWPLVRVAPTSGSST